jgi:ABC-type multidrug transport system permease subunit
MPQLTAVLVYVALSAIVGFLGRKRSVGFVGFFTFAILLSPLIAGLTLLATTPGSNKSIKTQ